jgi:VanZ family protein
VTEWRRRWAPVVLWLAVQLLLTSLPGNDLPDVRLPLHFDWVVHAGMYGTQGVLLARACMMGMLFSERPMQRVLMLVAALSALGALDELHQLFIPGRSAEVMDWVMDTIGGAAGVAAGTFLMTRGWALRWLR